MSDFVQYLPDLAVGFAAHGLYDYARGLLGYFAQRRPDLEAAAKDAVDSRDPAKLQHVFEDTVGAIRAAAASGEIELEGAFVTALNSIVFDHEQGRIQIGNATISSAQLITGGSPTATGETTISGNTSLQARGSRIDLGPGASIRMTGGASIKQE